MNRRAFLAAAGAALLAPALARAQSALLWYFRLPTKTLSDFAADLNAMIVANGYPAIMPANWQGTQSAVLPPIGTVRLDFDAFEIEIPTIVNGIIQSLDDRGLHVNAKLSVLPGADPTTAGQEMALWTSAIAAWFGASNGQPICPTLVSYTNSAPALYPSNGGQVWKSTGKSMLISPAPAAPKRVWA